MTGKSNADGTYVKGIEDYLPSTQYERSEHRNMVVENILENRITLTRGGKFHALFATNSISDAIEYYRLIKAAMPELKITALFDPTIDNGEGATTEFKENGLVEIITDYNARYGRNFDMSTHAKFKKDIAARLAHKEPHQRIDRTPEQQIDLLIVVDQMLTGFDSKWVNTLYIDKLLEYHNIIQAFSRTNRLFGPEKPFGTICYYRKPYTMEKNIKEALKLYSGDKPLGLYVQNLDENLNAMNELFLEIKKIFEDAGINDFTKNPDDKSSCGKFASLFKSLNNHLEAAKIQGFAWKQSEKETNVEVKFDENDYLILALRYKELFSDRDGAGRGGEIPYEIEGYLTEIDTGRIDAEYMNSRFEKYLKLKNLNPKPSKELVEEALDDLHKTFATLTQEEQKYAELFLHDIERGDVFVEEGKTFRDYITEYQVKAKDDRIHRIADILGMNEPKLREMMNLKLTEANINEYGRFDSLKDTVDRAKARAYFEWKQGAAISPFKASNLIDEFLRKFLLEGGFDVESRTDM
jgi:type I restriction enzyme R subunit